MELVVIDHHTAKKDDILGKANVRVPRGSRGQFFSTVEHYVRDSYDLVLTDQDPDGTMSASLYLLGQEKNPVVKTLRGGISAEDITSFCDQGIERVLALDWFGIYDSDLSAVDNVVLLNPTYSGLPHYFCGTQIVYEGIKDKVQKDMEETSLLLASLGIVSDYGTEAGLGIIHAFSSLHASHFSEALRLIEERNLDRYTVFDTPFDELSDMVWAPTVNKADEGSSQLINLISEHAPVVLDDLLAKTENLAGTFIQEEYSTFKDKLDREWNHYHLTAKEDDKTIIFEPQSGSKGFVQKFSSKVADKNPGKVILVRTQLPDKKWKYSLRRRSVEIDLGKLVKEMGVGGGIPPAAGCTVEDPDRFEQEFKKRIREIF